jgi:chromosome segregation ATPase
MGSDDSDTDGGTDDKAAALNNIVQPLRKQLKKQAGKIDKLLGVVKVLEDERKAEHDRREALEVQLTELRTTNTQLKTTLDANPWRYQGDQVEAALRTTEKRLSEALDEQRVQVAAHSQVFQSTQTTVSQLSQQQQALQADQSDAARKTVEEVRALTARLDHMRGEFSERMAHSFSESTTHSDRLGQRLQEDVQRLQQEVSLRAQAKTVSDGTAALHSEMNDLRTAADELRREVRAQNSVLQELKDTQSGFALKSSVRAHACANPSTDHHLCPPTGHRHPAAARQPAVGGGSYAHP